MGYSIYRKVGNLTIYLRVDYIIFIAVEVDNKHTNLHYYTKTFASHLENGLGGGRIFELLRLMHGINRGRPYKWPVSVNGGILEAGFL